MHKKPFPLKLQGQTKSLNKMETLKTSCSQGKKQETLSYKTSRSQGKKQETLSYKTSRSQGKKQETLSYKTSCSQGEKQTKITKFYKFKAALKAVMMRRHEGEKQN